MSSHGGGSRPGPRPGPRAGSRARKPIRAAPQGREPVKETPLVAAGQILLGLSLSCLIAVLVGCALIGVVFAVVYIFK